MLEAIHFKQLLVHGNPLTSPLIYFGTEEEKQVTGVEAFKKCCQAYTFPFHSCFPVIVELETKSIQQDNQLSTPESGKFPS